MKRITFVFALLVLFVSQLALAQNIKVTGTVKSASNGDPLIEASVTALGTGVATVTDVNGKYVINAPANATLEFRYVGCEVKQVAINGRTQIDVELADENQLDAAIVVGYGTARKISQVGSAQAVKTKTLKDRPVINVGDALQGAVAGLQVYSSSGDPSAAVSMRIRGVSSINASTAPLYILDGAPVASSIFTTLNANDIENVVILKDAASTAIYGSRAANGVVYITTKKGSGEVPTVRANFNYGISSVAQNPIRMANSKEYFELYELADPSALSDADYLRMKEFYLVNKIGTNWKKWLLHSNAPTMGGDISISGRGKVVDYYISLNANRQEGVERNTAMNRYGVRSNINVKVTNWFKAGLNLGLTYQTSRVASYNTTGNSWYNPLNMAMWIYPYASIKEVRTTTTDSYMGTGDPGEFLGYGKIKHYIGEAGLWDNRYLNQWRPRTNNYARINGNLYEEFTPIKGLTIRFAQALEGYDFRDSRSLRIDGEVFTAGNSGWATEEFARFHRLTSTNTIEYKFEPFKKHIITVLAGQEAIVNESTSFSAGSNVFTDKRLWAITSGEEIDISDLGWGYSKYTYNSIFARLSWEFADKYFVDASFRRDGSSLFGKNKRYANFWSVGATWEAKRENFLKDVKWIDKLNVSASYGTVGNSGIDNYLSVGSISQTSTPYDGIYGWYLNGPSNPDLTWETLETINFAIDTRLFNRFDAKIELYQRTTKDMLMEIPWSYATGFSGGWGNVGNMVNRGIEVTLGYDFIQKHDMRLTASLNFAYNKDKITKLFNGRKSFTVENTGLEYTVGHSAGEFSMVKWAGVDPSNGRPMWYDKNGNLTDTYNDDDAVLTGKSRYAPWSGGLNIEFVWKRFSLAAQFSGIFKKYMTNNDMYFWTNITNIAESNIAADVLYNTWRQPGDIAKYPAVEYTEHHFDTRFLENASFVRLKGVTLSYSVSDKALKNLGGIFKGIRVYVTGRNLLTWTKYKGWDPEINTNVSLGRYPNSKQVAAGIEITF